LINLTKESFGIGTAEALLLGVPVLGYNDGATPELVDKISGVLVDSKDQQSLLN
jgi:glycosyltransferase involved in cell wall biosynthesis